jgi:TRAP-type C4-dicarboxylate transport system permease small subunit
MSAIFALAAFGLILYTSSIYAWESWVARETMYGIKGGPLYVFKFGVPIGCFLMCIEVIIDLKNAIKQMMERS